MGAAPPSTVDAAPVPEPSVSAPTEEDGGFGDFDAAAPSTVDVPEPSVSTPTEEDDGFGDFDGAPPPGPSIAPAADDDDGFGDFDAAPPSSVVATQPSSRPTINSYRRTTVRCTRANVKIRARSSCGGTC